MPDRADASAKNTRTVRYGTRRRARLSQTSYADTLTRTDPPGDTLTQRCGRPHDRGLDIRDLCPPHATLPHGNARHSQGSSDISASFLDSGVRPRLVCGPSLEPHLPHRRQSFVLHKAVPRLSLLQSFRPVLWTQRMPFLKEKKTSLIHHGQAAQRLQHECKTKMPLLT